MTRRDCRMVLAAGVVLALVSSGGAYAGSKITSAQIKDGTITGRDIHDRGITGRDVADSSLSVDKLTSASLNALKQPGPPGPAGPPGPVVLGKLTRVLGPRLTVGAGQVQGTMAVCPAGQNVVSGGYVATGADSEVFASDSFGGPNSWSALLDNFDSSISADVTAIAYCAPAGAAITARAGRSTPAAVASAVTARIASHKH